MERQLIVAGAFDPDIARPQPIAQRGKHGGLVEPPIWLAIFEDKLLPLLGSERHRRVGRHLALSALIEIAQHLHCSQHRVVAAGNSKVSRNAGTYLR